ncbi:MAG: ATP-dependent helicase HrpB [Candidatus Thiodiazotropha sp.]
MPELPVNQVVPRLRSALEQHRRAVLSAPPGSGKTTQIPLQLLTAPWLGERKILMLEPRRLAARSAARYMASCLGEALGERVGYSIRLERRTSSATRIEVVTEGILTQRLQRDPELQGVGLVIFDEFHERNLHSDLALALCLDAQQGLREDLRLLVMSATLDQQRVCALLRDAPLIEAEGRQYPVSLNYLGWDADRRRIADQVIRAVSQAWEEQSGDLLVFLPGVGEIRAVQRGLEAKWMGAAEAPRVCPLFGDLPAAEQDRAIKPDPGGRRRIVLTTSIAETSLTIEGVQCVVDSGWSRQPRFIPGLGLSRLETVPVSLAAADQRAGRAGRLGPGVCYRLPGEAQHARLAAHHPAEILQADLAPLALQLCAWGISDPAQLQWLDPPPQAAFSQAMDLLRQLGGVDEAHRLTPMGRGMTGLPVHPRLAHLLLRAPVEAHAQACDLAALLSERDILPRSAADGPGCDLALRLRLLSAWRERGKADGLNSSACGLVDRVSRDWARRLGGASAFAETQVLSIGGLLALAFPDRIAQRTGHARFRLMTGRAARLAEHDPLGSEPYLVVPQLEAGQTESWIRLAAALDEAQIRSLPDLPIHEESCVIWDDQAQRVVAYREQRLGALSLSRTPLPKGDTEAVRAALLQGIRSMGMHALPWNPRVRQWQNRVCWLAQQGLESDWPDLSDDWLEQHLEEWLGPWLEGLQSRDQLQKLDLMGILQARLNWDQSQRLDQFAPSHLQVPSGSRIALAYAPDKPPVLAVRLQELFGLSETPRIAQGRVGVVLHLLSPAQRPIQITHDLAGFWARTYSEVKKELKGRYPKHYWPDDPLQAEATRRAKPRKR